MGAVTRTRIGQELNAALHRLMADDQGLHLLGQDIADPYGGAFKVTRGLSTGFPGRVLSTPISESAIVGMGTGLALCGEPAIVEIMFGDFAGLAFDMLVNFASKAVTMYGRTIPVPLLVRCPTGGNRGYGPTHSQSLQKHFLGVPSLDLFELTPFHEPYPLLRHILAGGRPAMLFEDKVLYGATGYRDGRADGPHHYRMHGDPAVGWAEAYLPDIEEDPVVLLASGGTAHRAMRAARTLLLDHEIICVVLVPARLYPLDLEPVLPVLRRAQRVVVIDDGPPGSSWAGEVAIGVYRELWPPPFGPVGMVQSKNSVIPAASHLERSVLVQAKDIVSAVLEPAG
ncbi:alpha-ketoacid dehydrogenase subunit beta [Nonomuraea sp. KC401]|uniref:alpha-ketoacid dehydrogenase subunit beta n=1 Tax=unclassified Nonomuraea TaxID=2593643 RepID=UPI0010FE9C7E|nr:MULTISPECIES: transketolase C-terminal domain-containing protein [unclassified Nonomuraea]NBE98018.1 alpha-ketoacid dehydrogenase subunit beta [Nonomuraea sp. K271]TLF60030.1 alpha-ketoacid dehydrogenase subunit beta [Nonomuraea sp. KC401]